MTRLLAIDMDGTCLNDKKCISAQTLQALRAAADNGILVVPTTGRALTCIPNQLKNEKFFRYVISSNGATVTDTATGNSLFDAQIPYMDVLDLLCGCKKLRLGISVHFKHQFILQGRLLHFLGHLCYGKDASYTKCEKDLAAVLKREEADVEEIQLFYFTKSAKKKTERFLSQYNNLAKAYSNHYVELYSQGASKGTALTALAEHLGICTQEIACIGDAENDLPMFSASGLKFAMGNAIPKLKNKADIILPTNNDDGVAHAIHNYLLCERK